MPSRDLLLSDFPPPRARRHRRPRRLRTRDMRRVHGNGSTGELSRACLVLAVQADGSTIETVEGLSRGGTLSELQAAFRPPPRAPVRLLHAGNPDLAQPPARARARAGRGADPRGARWTSVPLHRLCHHRRCGPSTWPDAPPLLRTTEAATVLDPGRILLYVVQPGPSASAAGPVRHVAILRQPLRSATF